MSARDWFILGCRLFGVWVVYMGVTYLASYLDARIGFAEPLSSGARPAGLLIYAFAHLGFGVYLLFGTRHLASLCYEPEGLKSREQEPTDFADRESS